MFFHFHLPRAATNASTAGQAELLSRDFILLFCLSLCSNGHIADFY